MKVFIDKNGKKLFFDESAGDLHTHFGILKKEQIVNAKSGETLETHLGEKFVVLDPDFVDLFENIERGPQIITLKDAGIISAFTGISSGSKVVEAGSGSGALTSYLANLVRPKGKLYSYEKRKDFLEIAKRNIEMFGLSKFVTFKNKCTHDTIEERDIDVVILDMPDPQNSVKNAEVALRPGGFLVGYLPHTEQVSVLLESCKSTGLKLIKVVDVVVSESDERLRFRPEIQHTAYMVFLRKL